MATHPWHQAALTELGELHPDTEMVAEAWRALVLVGRLLSAPVPHLPEAAWVKSLPRLRLLAGPSDPADLLERLATALEGDDDPAGPLHDALLDIDDELVVTAMAGGAASGEALALRAQGLVSLWPERVMALTEFAEMRCHTSRPDALEHALWSQVLSAPAEMLAQSLPSVSKNRPVSLVATASPANALTVPASLLRAAAASEEQSELQLGEHAWLFVEGGQLRVELAQRRPGATRLILRATDIEGSEVLVERAYRVEHPGTTATVVLGDAGIWEQVAAEANRPLTKLAIRLVVADVDSP